MQARFPSFHVSSFTGRDSKGNAHEVFVLSEHLNRGEFLAYSRKHAKQIIVAIVRFPEPNRPYYLAFFQQGREIQRCGSGTLAAATVLFNHGFNKAAKDEIAAITQHEKLSLLKKRQLLGYRCRKLTLFPERQAQFWQRAIPCHGQNVVSIQSTSAYTIVHLSSPQRVLNAQPKLQLLRLLSSRSLILTAQQKPNSRSNYVMRYFAPRYAQREDAATGSANSLLMQYWSNLGLGSTLQGQQLSPEGGEFFGRVFAHAVELYGKTETHI